MALTWLNVCVQSSLVFEKKNYLKTTRYNKFQAGFLLIKERNGKKCTQTKNIFVSSLWTQKPDK